MVPVISRRAFALGLSTGLVAARSGADTPPPSRPATELPLYSAFPALRATLPRLPLTELPTPIDAPDELRRGLALPGLCLKRDDQSARPYGGGKPRKLELFFGEALRLDKRRVATIGGVSSNHALATAIYAKRCGLGCVLLLMPEPPSASARRRLAAAAECGAELRLVPNQVAARQALAELSTEATTYAIPVGGTSALGNVGFVNAALELVEQIRRGELPEPERLYIPIGTMGSVAGLVVGLRLAGSSTPVVAVRASSPATSSQKGLLALCAETVEFLRARDPSFPALRFSTEDVTIDGRFLGSGYGLPTAAGERAARRIAELGGPTLETTYTAKTFAALLHAARDIGERPVLFWHTHTESEPQVSGDVSGIPPAFRGYFAAG
jgi:D-cysteine desulfhydrase